MCSFRAELASDAMAPHFAMTTLHQPNKADAPNPAITSPFQYGRHGRRIGDLRRWGGKVCADSTLSVGNDYNAI